MLPGALRVTMVAGSGRVWASRISSTWSSMGWRSSMATTLLPISSRDWVKRRLRPMKAMV